MANSPLVFFNSAFYHLVKSSSATPKDGQKKALVWKLSPFRIDFSCSSFQSFLDGWKFLVNQAISSTGKSVVLSLISFCVWCIWKARNRMVFEGVLWSPGKVVEKATTSFWEFREAKSQCKKLDNAISPPFSICWVPPDHRFFKCNIGANFVPSSCRGSGGAVFRDSQGFIIHAVVFRPFFASSAMVAEACAFQRAIFWPSSLGYNCLCFELDANVVVDAVVGQSDYPSEIATLCFDIKDDLKSFSSVSINHVCRLGNQVAHALVVFSRACMPKDRVLIPLPFQIVALARDDALGLVP
ncbi:uncharacterized protein LOC132296259 [Cornus florida]|uniref:uncharacterized protein LOC132296259 n=1 Tax=Cornus florida TaxID=4283 RepID=UPI00289F6A67|nr:uncharacterized protein LOC132296259 [Cornus florida]